MSFLKSKFNPSDSGSISNRFRKKRFRYFKELIKDLPKPVSVLDVGGTQSFWEQMNYTSPADINITILNNESIEITLPNFKFIQGSAADMQLFRELEFDVVFSNSVIEHLGNIDNQRKMADQIIRTGKKYFVQTPNYYFLIEPHFLFPFFQFLPLKIKIFLLMNFNLGWYQKQDKKENAEEIIDSIKLLTYRQLKNLFPDSVIIREKFLIFTKSFLIICVK